MSNITTMTMEQNLRASSATSTTPRAGSLHESMESEPVLVVSTGGSTSVKIKPEPLEIEDASTIQTNSTPTLKVTTIPDNDEPIIISSSQPIDAPSRSPTALRIPTRPYQQNQPVHAFRPNSFAPGSSGMMPTTSMIKSPTFKEMGFKHKLPQQPSPLWDMIERFPNELAMDSNKFNHAMKQWTTATIDDIKMPVLMRPNSIQIIPITVIQTKLYSQFARNVVDVMFLTPLNSYYLEPVEAWMYNVINSTTYNNSLGLKIFQSKEECVDIREVALQYWRIKKFSLEQMFGIYNADVPPGTHYKRNVTGTILQLKKSIYNDIKKIEERLQAHAPSTNFR